MLVLVLLLKKNKQKNKSISVNFTKSKVYFHYILHNLQKEVYIECIIEENPHNYFQLPMNKVSTYQLCVYSKLVMVFY